MLPAARFTTTPTRPFAAAAARRSRKLGDDTPIAYLTPEQRYVEKLATPDVTIADLIGDIDPIKAARGGHELSSEYTVHYGLLPRANHGIFAINELPDLAGKIQVGLFNIMQEGDVQIKGYPIRLPLDVALVFSANPEDYTARGKIITPLKDRIGSEIRTHYPATVEEGITITAQEVLDAAQRPQTARSRNTCRKSSSASPSPPAKTRRSTSAPASASACPSRAMENVISNAERRAIHQEEKLVVPRIADVYAAMPAITGKLELEYEGEMKGADHVSRELIRAAVAKTHDAYFKGVDMQQIVQWFDLGGEIQLADTASAAEALPVIARHPGPDGKDGQSRRRPQGQPGGPGFSGRIYSGRPARAQTHRPQRRASLHRRREATEADRKALRARRTPFRGRRPYN